MTEFTLCFLITLNLVFSGLARSVHLDSNNPKPVCSDNHFFCNSHIFYRRHEYNFHGRNFFLAQKFSFKTGAHGECSICKISDNLHKLFIFNNQNHASFTPFHLEGANQNYNYFDCGCRLIYHQRAPPLVRS